MKTATIWTSQHPGRADSVQLCWIVVRQKQLVVQILVDAVTQSFPDSRVVVDSLDRGLSQESGS